MPYAMQVSAMATTQPCRTKPCISFAYHSLFCCEMRQEIAETVSSTVTRPCGMTVAMLIAAVPTTLLAMLAPSCHCRWGSCSRSIIALRTTHTRNVPLQGRAVQPRTVACLTPLGLPLPSLTPVLIHNPALSPWNILVMCADAMSATGLKICTVEKSELTCHPLFSTVTLPAVGQYVILYLRVLYCI